MIEIKVTNNEHIVCLGWCPHRNYGEEITATDIKILFLRQVTEKQKTFTRTDWEEERKING